MSTTPLNASTTSISLYHESINENARRARFLNAASPVANFTVWADDTGGAPIDVYYVDCTSGTVTVTLPAIASADVALGRAVRIVRVDASGNSVTVDPNGSETVRGSATFTLASQWDSVLLHPRTSSDWAIL